MRWPFLELFWGVKAPSWIAVLCTNLRAKLAKHKSFPLRVASIGVNTLTPIAAPLRGFLHLHILPINKSSWQISLKTGFYLPAVPIANIA